jgi:hypothetical protein
MKNRGSNNKVNKILFSAPLNNNIPSKPTNPENLKNKLHFITPPPRF